MKKLLLINLFIFNFFVTLCAMAEGNPLIQYFIKGNTVSPWQWAVGNEKNYYIPLSLLKGKTVDGVLMTEQGHLDSGSQTLKAKWNGKGEGRLFLSGKILDLSAYEHKVAIAADYKINEKPRRLHLTMRVDCDYPCGGEVGIGKQFQNKPQGEWFTFPVPLNCFSASGADLSKISSIYQLQTAQKLSIEIKNVRLILLPENEKGCQ